MKHSLSTAFLGILLFATFLLGNADATAIITYASVELDPNPASQGWTAIETSAPGVDADNNGLIDSPANNGPVIGSPDVSPLWQVYDRNSAANLNRPGYSRELTTSDLAKAYQNGWTYEVTARAKTGLASAGFTGWGLTLANDPGWGLSKGTRVGFHIRLGADNAFEVSLDNGTIVTLGPGTADQLHTIRAEGQPRSPLFEWFINDVSQGVFDLRTVGPSAGISSTTIYFGAHGSTAIMEATDWGEVRFSSGAAPSFSSDPLAREIQSHDESIIGNGVDAATGAFKRGHELLSVSVGSRQIGFPIFYDSRLTNTKGPLGYGWSHDYEARLFGVQGEDIFIQWNANKVSQFSYDADADDYRGVEEDVRYADLFFLNNGWTVIMLDGTRLRFSPGGTLLYTANQVDDRIDMVYNAERRLIGIEDQHEQSVRIDLEYNNDGLLTALEDPLGRRVELTYDDRQRLIGLPSPVLVDETVYGEPLASPASIPDNDANGVRLSFEVSESGPTAQVQVASLYFQHSRPNDLTITVTSPAGTSWEIPPPMNSEASLAGVVSDTRFDGEDRAGTWELHVVDNIAGNQGTVDSFMLRFSDSSRKLSYTYEDGDFPMAGRILAAHDLMGAPLFSCTYDSLGRVLSQDDGRPDTPATTFTYAELPNGNVVTTATDALGNKLSLAHDAAFRLLEVADPLGHSVHFTYDADGNRLSRTDARNRTTTFTYDEIGNLSSMTDAAGHTTTFGHTSDHNVSTITDALGHESTFIYVQGRMTAVTDELDHTDKKAYSARGEVTKLTQADGAIVDFGYTNGQLSSASHPAGLGGGTGAGYDAAGRMLRMNDSAGLQTDVVYNASSDVISQTDPSGNTVTAEYDTRGRLVRQIDKRGFESSFTYDGNNNRLTATNALGQTTHYAYDALDRLVQVTNPAGHTTSYTYDALGRRTAVTDPLGRVTRTEYDPSGNVIANYDPSGLRVLSISYDERNLPVRFEDALGHVSTAIYDAVGRKTSATDALGRTTTFTYDRIDRPVTVTDALGRETTAAYKNDDMLDTLTGAGSGAVSYVYDAANNLKTVQFPSGNMRFQYTGSDRVSKILKRTTLTLKYNENTGRLNREIPSGATTQDDHERSFSYDAAGNLTAIGTSDLNSGGNFTDQVFRTYDPLNRLLSYTDENGNVISYTYDLQGNVSSITYPDDWVVSYAFDEVNRLTRVTDGDGRVTRYTWNRRDLLTFAEYPNGTTRHLRYDNNSQIRERDDLDANGNIIVSYRYVYDSAGRLQAEQTEPTETPIIPQARDFTYNNENRLTTYDGQTLTYDTDGNLSTGPAGFGLDLFLYNTRGKLYRTDGFEYDYDEEDRLIGWKPRNSNDDTTFVQHPNGRLSQVLTKTDPDGTLTRYVYGLGLAYQVEEGNVRVFHHDHRGSTVALSNDAGLTAGRVTYDPYGKIMNRLGDTDTIFLYNGLFGVFTGPDDLVYMRFRWYWPEIGRFITADAHLGGLSNPATINRYTYAHGNPIMQVDPQGEFAWILAGAAAGAVVNVAVLAIVDLHEGNEFDAGRYGAAALGGAVTGAIIAGTGGLGGAVIGGAAGAATENLFGALFAGEAVDAEQLALDTAIGGASGALGHGAGKVGGKVTGKLFSKYKNTPFVGRAVRKFFTPAKVARRAGVQARTPGELKARLAWEQFRGRLPTGIASGVISGVTKDLRENLKNSAFEYFGYGAGKTGAASQGGWGSSTSIYLQAASNVTAGRTRIFGEYAHFDRFLTALSLADRSFPNNPSATLAGF